MGEAERINESIVRPKDDGLTIVEWLCSRFAYCGRAGWEQYLQSGEVTLNGAPAALDKPVHDGDRIRFTPRSFDEPTADVEYRLVRETVDYVIIDKPSNLPCHPGGRYFKKTLWYLLRERYGEVHFISRLDRETSGLVLVARSAEAARWFHAQQAAEEIQKTYLVLVHGEFPTSLQCRGYLVPDTASVIRKKRRFESADPDTSVADQASADVARTVITSGDAAPAVGRGAVAAGAAQAPGSDYCETRFDLAERRGEFSLVAAELITGRTHQIRATLCSLGYPVVGDKIYGLDETLFLRFIQATLDEADRRRLILDRQALHAHTLRFRDRSGQLVEVRAAVPF